MAELTDGQIEDILRRKLTVRPTKGSSDSAGERPNSDAAASRQSGRPVPSADDFSEELQCPICLERFLQPSTLGCGHTLCADCLQKVRSESGDMCPMCRAPIESTARSVTIENIISSMASGP